MGFSVSSGGGSPGAPALTWTSLAAAVTGGSYASLVEQNLDKELETFRTIRDKLGAVSEQWRLCSTLIQAASKSTLQALNTWNLLMKLPSDRTGLCLDCRQALTCSIVALTEAQSALSQVDVPSISSRQVAEVQHINQYLLTDMVNEGRAKQIVAILDDYHRNTVAALEWVQKTYQDTVAKNFQEAERNVQETARKLREERIKFISVTMGRGVSMASELKRR